MKTLGSRSGFRALEDRARIRVAGALALTALLLALPRAAPLRAQGGAAPGLDPDVRPELELQIGHLGSVDSVVFSPDGKTLASAGGDQIKRWDVATGTLQWSENVHPGERLSLALSPDGTTLVSGGADAALRAFNARTGEQLWTLPVKPGWCPVAFSPDGTMLAGGETDGSVSFWDARTRDFRRAFRGDRSSVVAITFSPDGSRLASSDFLGELKVRDVQTGELRWSAELAAPSGPDPPQNPLAFSPDGKTLASGTAGEIRLWDAETGALLRTLTGHSAMVTSVAFSPDGELLASGSRDFTVRLWDAGTGALQTLHYGGIGDITAVAFSREGQMLAIGSTGGGLMLWGLRTRTLSRGGGLSFALALSPDGRTLVSAGNDLTLRWWDARSGALQRTLTEQSDLWAVAFSPDGKTLAGMGSHGVRLLDAQTGAELRILDTPRPLYGAQVLALAPDGKTVASADLNEISLRDLASGAVLRTLTGHTEAVTCVAYSPDGRTLVSGSNDKTVRWWDARTGDLLRTLTGHTGPLLSLAFSPDGQTLATGGGNEVRLWDARTGELRRTWTEAGPVAMFFSPDGKTLAVGLFNQLVLRDVQTGALQRTLAGHTLWIVRGAFSPDGKQIISGSIDQTIRIWDVSTGRPLATLITLPPREREPVSTDWLTMTPQGYYDGSPGAGRFIRWRVGTDRFPVEAYERSFHRPDLLARILRGETVPETPQLRRFVQGRAIPPQVTITRPHNGQTISGNTVRVEVTVTDDRSDVRVEVRVNGRPVATKPITVGAKPILVGGKSIPLTGEPIPAGARPIVVGSKPLPAAHRFLHRLITEVPLPPGNSPVALKVVATDTDALQGWDELHLHRPLAAPAVARAAALGDLYVLAIGVSRYQNPRYDLKYAAADALAFAGLWKPMQGWLYHSVHTAALTDAQATTANVRAALFRLLETATSKDSVALFLSGHGVQVDERAFYFATHDIDATSPQRVQETALPWTVFETTLAKLDARRVFLFLDACHSGSALGEQQASSERLAEALARHGNVLVFASSRAGEVSYEEEGVGHGAFTQALLEGIGQGKADLEIGGKRDGQITAGELLAYLGTRVPQLTQNRQTPTCPLLYDFGESYLLARAR